MDANGRECWDGEALLSGRWRGWMSARGWVAFLPLLAGLTGCLTPRLGDMSGAPLATPSDLALEVRCEYGRRELEVALRNVSGHTVAITNDFVVETVWTTHGATPGVPAPWRAGEERPE